jgi:Phospholipid methyltransferase
MEKSQINWPAILEGQLIHALALILLLALAIAASGMPGALEGQFLGISTGVWFFLMLADTIIHQVYVWFCWRFELHGRRLTQWFGGTERAFQFYARGFAAMFGARFVLIVLLAISNRGTLNINPMVGYLIALAIAAPAGYLFYSVRTYFSFRRAFGIDHFDREAANWPLVREGIFRFTSNAMYVFGIGALWIPVFALQSLGALVAAAFSHAYIWVHYFTVERPDMRRIYG